jgi:hypothetical protein
MARGGKDEHRMVFDVRGKRRGVVKVVYAILALLMGLSLFLLGAGGSLSSIFGGNGSSGSATKAFEEQAQRIERKLIKSPEDPNLLLNLTRTRVNAGNSAVVVSSSGEQGQTLESQEQFNKASAAWSEYLEATDEPNSGLAQLMSNTLFTLAGISRTTAESEANIQAAAEAQAIVAKQRPSVGSLSTQSLYLLYTFDYPAAEKVKKEAIALTKSKFERESFENQYEEVEKRAKEFQKQLAEAEKEAEKAQKQGTTANPEGGQNPFGAGAGSLGE